MPRAFWKGVISFGMVAIPVRMSVAVETSAPSFHYLHEKCLTRPKQVLYCEEDDEYFTRKETVRGYEYSKGQYVIFDDDDFEKVPVRTTHSIDIIGFVNRDEIDVIYYADCHYIEPEELGIKPFHLLKKVLEKTGKVAIAKVAFQRKEHVCCLRSMGEVLSLHTLHYKEDILPVPEAAPPEKEPAAAELDMAEKLIEVMVTEFKPDEYRDEYALALQKMVEAKLQGVEIKAPEEAPVPELEDLMTALRESVAAASKS
jgi:DNA end-binding protein Ku